MADLLAWGWLRRKQFESRILAVEIVNTLGQAMGGAGGQVQQPHTSSDRLLQQMGVTLS